MAFPALTFTFLLLCEEKRKIFLQTSPFPAVKTRKMKGLLGINYSQHLADEDGLESDQEGDDKSHIFLLSEKAFCAHYRWPRSGTKHSFLSHYDLLQCTFWEIKHSCCWFMFYRRSVPKCSKVKTKMCQMWILLYTDLYPDVPSIPGKPLVMSFSSRTVRWTFSYENNKFVL